MAIDRPSGAQVGLPNSPRPFVSRVASPAARVDRPEIHHDHRVWILRAIRHEGNVIRQGRPRRLQAVPWPLRDLATGARLEIENEQLPTYATHRFPHPLRSGLFPDGGDDLEIRPRLLRCRLANRRREHQSPAVPRPRVLLDTVLQSCHTGALPRLGIEDPELIGPLVRG